MTKKDQQTTLSRRKKVNHETSCDYTQGVTKRLLDKYTPLNVLNINDKKIDIQNDRAA